MRETDWIVGMPTLAMTGFEHHFDNPAEMLQISTHHRITFDDGPPLIAQPPHFTTSLATLFGDMDLAVVDRFESSIDRIENRATERIMSRQEVMGVELVACVVLRCENRK